MNKRFFTILLTGMIGASILSGCSESETSTLNKGNEVKEVTVSTESIEVERLAVESKAKAKAKAEVEAKAKAKAKAEVKAEAEAKAKEKEIVEKEREQAEAKKKPVQTQGTTNQVPVELVKTIDGDTIKVVYEGQEVNVRYLLIDTPETSHPKLGKQPFGEEAKEFNRTFVNSGKVTLEFDIGERIDRYGRLLAYVYVDGKMAQEAIVREGLARVGYVYPPNTRHLDILEQSEAKAKQDGFNIWSKDGYVLGEGFASDDKVDKTTSVPEKSAAVTSGSGTDFKNCTELRKIHPAGVPKGHTAYQSKMDRDNDGYACD